MYKNAVGTFHFLSKKGAVEGIDLDKLAVSVQHLNDLSGLLGLLKHVTESGKTTYLSFGGLFSINNGMAETANTTMQTQGASIVTKGSINLAAQTMLLNSAITFTKAKEMPPLGLRLSGHVRSPNIDFDMDALQKTLLHKGVGALIGGLLGEGDPKKESNKADIQGQAVDLLKGILGGDTAPKESPAAAPDPSTEKVRVDKADGKSAPQNDPLKAILKGIFE